MDSKWGYVKIADIADVIGGGTPSTKRIDFYGGNIPWITPKDLSQHSDIFIGKGERSITKLGLDNSSARLLPKNTVLMSSRAPIGYVAIAKNELCTNQGFKSLVLKENQHPLFYYYLLKHNKPLFENRATGTTFKEISGKVLQETEIYIPLYLKTQQKIAKVLGDLDKKITLNNQINETLEEMAQALFKSWFIDFEPVKAKMEAKDAGADETEILLAAMSAISGKDLEALKVLQTTAPEEYAELKAIAEQFPDSLEESELGMIPKGWGITDIGSVCHFQNGNAFKSKELIKEKRNSYKVFKMGGIQKGGGFKEPSNLDFYPKNNKLNYDQYLIQKGDLLMCMTDMKNNVALLGHTAIMPINNEYLLNQRVGRIRTRNKTIVNFPFLYLLTNNKGFLEDLRSRANSGVQVNLSTKSITESSFILPSQNIHSAFNQIMEEAFEVIFKNMKQNKTLTELRDTLLPKLLSGEIDVSNVEIDELLENEA